MKLELKPEFEVEYDDRYGYTYVAPNGAGWDGRIASWNPWSCFIVKNKDVVARGTLNGQDACEMCHKLILEHCAKYGTESPWREVPTDAELTAAAEGEGPSIDDDAEARRRHRANLHRIQVVDDGAANRCRCAWVVTEPPAPRLVGIDYGRGDDTVVAFAYAIASKPPAPRLCAVDRLEAAGYKLQARTGTPTFVKPNARIQVVVGRVGDAYRCSTAGDISKPGDPLPGLNAALESLLSKPVGAVTVAQILGVA